MAATDAPAQAQPYTFDLGHLLCIDPNPLPPLPKTANLEDSLSTTARNCAQSLLTQLLTTCPITHSDSDGALQVTLPAPEFHLPREKPVPKEKEKSKWEKFAEKKGIKAKRKDGKLVFDEGKGDWVAKYGYQPGKRNPGEVESDWLVEVDEKAERRKAEEEAEGKKGPPKKKNPGGGDIARRDKKLKMRKGK